MKKIFALILPILILTGCASITSGKVQPLSVVTTCDGEPLNGASCTLINDKGSWFVKTPGSVSINKAYGDLTAECKLGESKGSATFSSKSEGAVWGNIIAGGIIGYAVDAGTGAGFSYPPQLAVNMSGGCLSGSSNKNEAKSK
jgi:hypothetical protein